MAVIAHEVPFWLLAATFTPLGPIGSVIGIAFLDHKRRSGEDEAAAAAAAT